MTDDVNAQLAAATTLALLWVLTVFVGGIITIWELSMGIVTPAKVTAYLTAKKWSPVTPAIRLSEAGECAFRKGTATVQYADAWTSAALVRDVVQQIAKSEGREFRPVYDDIAKMTVGGKS